MFGFLEFVSTAIWSFYFCLPKAMAAGAVFAPRPAVPDRLLSAQQCPRAPH